MLPCNHNAKKSSPTKSATYADSPFRLAEFSCRADQLPNRDIHWKPPQIGACNVHFITANSSPLFAMRLGHLRLPGLTPYHHAARIQEALIQKHFLAKDLWRRAKLSPASNSPTIESPDAIVITAEFKPVYTFGRRQLNTVSEEQRRFLEDNGKAAVLESQRGGQVTYHGPGQLVAYPIINLRRHKITPRDYVRLLEETVVGVCTSFGVPAVETTEDPGVWVKGGQHKICALGVRIRRGITGHGIGLNVTDREESLSWGFGRIVACGLEGKGVTWLTAERAKGSDSLDVEPVASEFVKALATRLGGIEEIYQASEEEAQKQPDNFDIA